MNRNTEEQFAKQFGNIVTADDRDAYNHGSDVKSKVDDTLLRYIERKRNTESLDISNKQSAKRIFASASSSNNNNNVGHILEKNTLFGSKRKKHAALKYVNKYLSSTDDFPFNDVDEIKFEEIDSKLVGECISVVLVKYFCHNTTKS